ncbi:D-2-hydroxyacid dehydrogenase family protein [Xanthomonas rydalmerensis]|uniref:D-2-hydroxyacid dehydrogenase family protein n=1 Tax=Xanthomonas rydalmerensis TaxID=3046274 RepID=A0ABZ0JPR6_9XANT|nr:D-2-hydroxyacid dehydrogenase family protein [Xanthomonas sp. DM-2023]WOS41338.1 D-2-hydroxyacid dehydrogenase family protein [Xanthomonas sp. DM-2023]WOS45523.1 D-2-hydroxyacid dehydrogenase family protein [Xanthomonas sp. DM-2023]WOS49702.1 D-2-hydroxyacid dehydrogenase family protein [Xanthomonas sp. DM-2023]WOS53882.1 D-2-hydroxyacid dehydrogenase family protein [Xanthomonas sp. DM-2023]WOS58065.1 D-2-hydroxyacid dehydrogenase family protein [Xanthomonas sp. DM-2023]
MRILIADDYQDAVRHLPCFARLHAHSVQVLTALAPDRQTLVRHAAEAEALMLIRERTRIDAALLAQLPKLRLISQTGRIGEHIDLAACTARGVAVAEGVGSPVAPAELTWALLMAASRRLPAYRDALLAGHWQATGDAHLGRSVDGLTLGIWSYGKIGRRVAAYGRAFGMRVQVWGGEDSCAQARADGFAVAASREALFAESDVLTLHRRLAAATRHQIGLDDLLRMKPDALLVNTSRAELLAPGALLAALEAGRPGQAALDVFEQEPVLDPQHPLLRHPRVLATPHLGYVEHSSYDLYFGAAFDNVLAFAAGTPQRLANPDVLSAAD